MDKPRNQLVLYKFCPQCRQPLKHKIINQEEVRKCDKCGFIFWNNPKPVVSILLLQNNEILMLQRASEPLKDYWCLPGGYIQYEETPEEAIKREVKEEIGAEIEIERLINVNQIDNDPRGINIDIVYRGKLKGNIRLSAEHKRFKLIPYQNLPEKIAYKHREVINDWFKGQNHD